MDQTEIISENPFTGSYILRVIRTHLIYNENHLKKLMEAEESNEKDYFDAEAHNKATVYENTTFAKQMLGTAKPNTLRLYFYIVSKLSKDKDWINLRVNDIKAELGISRPTMYTAIEQLRDFRLLSPRKGRNVYWINTELLFNGNRIKYIQESAPGCVDIVLRRKRFR